jgi:hypothetical protein
LLNIQREVIVLVQCCDAPTKKLHPKHKHSAGSNQTPTYIITETMFSFGYNE